MCTCVRLCAVFLTAYHNKTLLVSTDVETAKTLKYDLVMISEGAGKQDGLTASCKVIATGTIVIDRKFIHGGISQIPGLLDSNYVVKTRLFSIFLQQL